MIAASQWQPVILESELPEGKLPETRLRDWLPGRCGLLPLACFSEQARAAGLLQTVAKRGCKIADPQSALAKVALACECRQAEVHHGAASAVTRASQEYTNDAAQGWLALGPHSIFKPRSSALRVLPRSSQSHCRRPIEYFREVDRTEHAISARRFRLFHRVRDRGIPCRSAISGLRESRRGRCGLRRNVGRWGLDA